MAGKRDLISEHLHWRILGYHCMDVDVSRMRGHRLFRERQQDDDASFSWKKGEEEDGGWGRLG